MSSSLRTGVAGILIVAWFWAVYIGQWVLLPLGVWAGIAALLWPEFGWLGRSVVLVGGVVTVLLIALEVRLSGMSDF